MKKLIKRGLSLVLAFNHLLVLASPTQISRTEIVAHLEGQRDEFKEFYRSEQLWLESRLLPVVEEVGASNIILNAYEKELASWPDLSQIEKELPVNIKIRAQRMMKDIVDAGLYLYLAELNLRAAAQKHLDSLNEIYIFVGQVGARYEDLKIKLQIVNALYERSEKSEQILKQSKIQQEHFYQQQKKIIEIKQTKFRAELQRITHLLQSAKRHQSRTLWLAALRTYQTLLEDKELLAENAVEIEKKYNSILEGEVTHFQAKEDFKRQIDRLQKDEEASLSVEAINFFHTFFVDPYPRMKAYLQAEQYLAEALQHQKVSVRLDSFGWSVFLISTNANGKNSSGRKDIPSDKEEVEVNVFNSHDIENGRVVEKVHVEIFTTDSTGRRVERARYTENADSFNAERIREHFNISSSGRFGKTETHMRDKPNMWGGEFSGPGKSYSEQESEDGEVHPSDIPSPSDNNSIKSKVKNYETKDTKVTETQVGSPITPSNYTENRKQLYSSKNLIDRADVHNGNRDFGDKTSSFDPGLAELARNVSNEIRAGETALQSGFVGLIDKLRADMNNQNRSFPEATTGDLDANDAQSIGTAIAKANSVVGMLRSKLQSSNHPHKAQIETGLNTAEVLLNSATQSLNVGDVKCAKALTDIALRVIADYGPAVLRLGLGFSPAGDIVDLVELLSGKDALSGQDIGAEGRVLAGLGLLVGSRAMWSQVSGVLSKVKSVPVQEALSAFKDVDHFGPVAVEGVMKTNGPLDAIKIIGTNVTLASTFRSGTYTMMSRTTSTKLYRSVGPNGKARSNFWSLSKPAGPTSEIIDKGLPNAFRNDATRVFEAEIPAGTSFGVGVAEKVGKMPAGGVQAVVADPDVLQNIKEVTP